MKKTYQDFLEDLAASESSGRYDVVNQIGYLGKYQMGKAALIDAGYYQVDGTKGNKFIDSYWTGKDGVKAKEDFLKNPQAQENAMQGYKKAQWEQILIRNLDRFIGQDAYGVHITISGLLAGAHLKGTGAKGLSGFLRKGINSSDGNGTTIKSYIEKFAGYETPFEKRKKLLDCEKNKNGKVINYLVEDIGWVDKGVAIQMVRGRNVDAVIVKSQKGTVFLKTPPDEKTGNNLVK